MKSRLSIATETNFSFGKLYICGCVVVLCTENSKPIESTFTGVLLHDGDETKAIGKIMSNWSKSTFTEMDRHYKITLSND